MSLLSDATNLSYGDFDEKYPGHTSRDSHRFLRGLDELKSALGGGAFEPLDPAAPDGGFAVTAVTRTTGAGSTPAGALFASFKNVHASANATVAGATLKPGESLSIPTSDRILLAAIAYVATGSELLILTVSPPA